MDLPHRTPDAVDAVDAAIVARQIGRPPRGLHAVESRCRWGHPVVVSVDPVVDGRSGREPFPTRFWLTCPLLVAQVSRIESAGGIGALGRRIEADPDLAAELDGDHARCAAERRAALVGAHRDEATDRGFLREVETTGIGGTRPAPAGGDGAPATFPGSGLKCLHAHYGFHRARGGVAGRLMEEEHDLRECDAAEAAASVCAAAANSFRGPPGV